MPKTKAASTSNISSSKATGLRRSLNIPFLNRVTLADKIFFIENLRVMLRSGLPLSRSFQILSLQTESAFFRGIISDIGASVERGETLAGTLARYPKIFPSLIINMIRVGEVSGTLERALGEISLQMKKEAALRSKVRGALAYPIVVITATAGIGAGMMIYVVPKILAIFSEVNIELPLTTRILIAIASAVDKHGLIVALGLLAAIALFVTLHRLPAGKKAFQTVLLRFPIIGPIIKKVNMARFTRTLSSLLKSEVPVIDACLITADVLQNVHYRAALIEAADRVKRGVSVADALSSSPLFPALVTQMAAVGEQSGSLDELLGELAVFYEAQVDETLGNFAQVIEPLLIIVLGVVVGGMAFAIISPIYTLADNINT